MINRFFLISLFFLLPLLGSTQSQLLLDSLQVELNDAESDFDKADILIQISRLYMSTDIKSSINYAEEAIEVLDRDKQTSAYAQANRFLGNSLLTAGSYSEALDYFFKGLTVAVEIEDNFEQFALAVSIGVVYDRLEKFDESMKYNFEALNAYNDSKGTKDEERISAGMFSLYNNIGNNYHSNLEYEKAEEYYNKALDVAEAKGNLYQIGTVSNNLGKMKAANDDFETAMEYLEKSEEARVKAGDKSGLGKTYSVMAEFYLKNGDYDKVIDNASRAMNLAQEVGAMLTQRTVANILSMAYDSIGDYKNAYHYQKLLKEIGDSIFNEKTISEVTRLQFINEQAIIDNQRLQEVQKVRTRNTIIISLLFVVLVILAALLGFSKNRQKRALLEKKDAENSIIHKKKELATNVLYLLRKNEAIESVTKKLLELKVKVTPDNKGLVQRIIMELETEIDTNSWKEFELRFQDVHQTFYEKLNNLFPDLTPSERKLAAFLKLNMSSKEISVITGQSIRSLEVARYRLRKKLGITNQDINLINFLSDL